MNQHQSNDEQFEELSINTVEGLRVFLENAQAQYRTGLAALDATDFERSEQLEKIFDAVRQVAKRLIINVSDGKVVDHADAAELQQKYDRLISFLQQSKTAPAAPKENQAKKAVAEEKKVPVQSTEQKSMTERPVSSPQSQQNASPVKKDTATQAKTTATAAKSTTLSSSNEQSEPFSANNTKPTKKTHLKKETSESATQSKTDLANALQKLQTGNVEKKVQKKSQPAKQNQPTPKKSTKKSVPKGNPVIPEKVVAEEVISLKPKTGALRVAVEEVESKKVTEEVTMTPEITEIKAPVEVVQNEVIQSDVPEPALAPADVESSQLLEKIRKTEGLSMLRRDELVAAYPNPNTVQQLLFDEVTEGIEYLSHIQTAEQITSATEETILQVVSHVRRALQSIREAAFVEVDGVSYEADRVPVVTEQAQNIVVT